MIHYNAGQSTYKQLIRNGLDANARMSLLHTLKQITGRSDIDIAKEIKPLSPDKEKIWNEDEFTPELIMNTIVKASYTNPEWNPMNGSIIIVDESHNFIS